MGSTVRIMVVDDHTMVRDLLAEALTDEPDFDVVARLTSGEEALADVGTLRADVAVLDNRLPGLPGVEVCAEMHRRSPSTRVVLLTSLAGTVTVHDAIAAGARGVVTKSSDTGVLRRAVRAAARDEPFVDPLLAGTLIDAAVGGQVTTGPDALTHQEQRILALLPCGLTTAEIADRLGVGDQTVKSHIGEVLRKLGARNRAQIVALAMQRGLL